MANYCSSKQLFFTDGPIQRAIGERNTKQIPSFEPCFWLLIHNTTVTAEEYCKRGWDRENVSKFQYTSLKSEIKNS